MSVWASDAHRRLWLMGFNGRERQQIIDASEALVWDPIELGCFIVTQSSMQLDNLEMCIPHRPWHREAWLSIVYAFRLAKSVVLGWRA